MKRLVASFIVLLFVSCAEMQQIATQLPGELAPVTPTEMSLGLKEALRIGVLSGVDMLSKKDGFLKNELTRIVYPEQLRTIDQALRRIGMAKLADEGLTIINRAAEDAVSEAAPIFTNAIAALTFNDVKNILFGGQNAATSYLRTTTESQLITAFSPKVRNSIQKVGADKVWNNIITTYNNIPTVQKVNPDLTSYITGEAINGLFKMVAQKEAAIRTNVNERTSALLRRVFALQDKKSSY